MGITNTIWANKKERKFLNLGYITGFFNADGHFTIATNGTFYCGFTQKTKEPLNKIKKILNNEKIKTNLYQDKNIEKGRIKYELKIARDDISKFLDLIEGHLEGQKKKDYRIFKKIVNLYERTNKEKCQKLHGLRWKKDNKEELKEIIKKWKNQRLQYRN